jgi:osmoprotectant transport system substrate-binding protein
MRTPRRTRSRLLASAVATLLAGACAGDSGTSAPPGDGAPEVVVASFNFPESVLLAEMYAQSLEQQGIGVRRELGLGPRELVLPALQQGLVDVVPEYVGSATVALTHDERPPGAQDASAVQALLARTLRPWHARPLRLSPAENVNSVVMLRARARELRVSSISDLAPIARSLRLGGPPECPVRPYCLRGLERVYGLRFAEFVPLEGEQRVQRALEDGVVDAGIMFTTDGSLGRSEITTLADDRNLQPAENVVPVVREEVVERHGTTLVRALDAVSAALTTENLRFLNWRVGIAGHPAADEARAWLLRHALVPRRA